MAEVEIKFKLFYKKILNSILHGLFFLEHFNVIYILVLWQQHTHRAATRNGIFHILEIQNGSTVMQFFYP